MCYEKGGGENGIGGKVSLFSYFISFPAPFIVTGTSCLHEGFNKDEIQYGRILGDLKELGDSVVIL